MVERLTASAPDRRGAAKARNLEASQPRNLATSKPAPSALYTSPSGPILDVMAVAGDVCKGERPNPTTVPTMTTPTDSPPLTLLLATSNPHKLEEIREMWSPPRLRWLTLADLDAAPAPPEEDQPTFEGNARLKARYYADATGLPCIADDSGVEVDALGGAPGVRSARYSGATGPRREVDLANNATLLEALEDVPAEKRTARFVCAIAAVGLPARSAGPVERPSAPGEAREAREAPTGPSDSGAELVVRGAIEGRILCPQEATDPARPETGRGENGFGYDPLFLVPELGRTTAELTPEHKNRISHRGRAARQLAEQLQRWID